MDLVVNFLIFLLKYISIFIFFFFLGRTLVILFNIKNLKNINIDYLKIFNLPINLFYPILGVILFGNILFIVNFIFPIGNNFLIFLVFSIQLLNFMKKFNFNNENDFNKQIMTFTQYRQRYIFYFETFVLNVRGCHSFKHKCFYC